MDMTFEINFDLSEGYVYIKTAGHANPMGFDEMIKHLVNNPKWKPGTNQLVDHRNLKGKNLKSNEVELIKEIVNNYTDEIGFGKCAYVIPDTLGYGLVRMYEGMGGDRLHGDMAVFYDLDEAVNWLKK